MSEPEAIPLTEQTKYPPVGTRVKATLQNHPTFIGTVREYVSHDTQECGNCFMARLEKDKGHSCEILLTSGRFTYYTLKECPKESKP